MGPQPKVVANSNQTTLHSGSGMDARARELTRQLSHSLVSQDSHGSLASIFSQLAGSDSALSEELYQLSILWVGLWAGLNQLRDQLGAMQEAWSAFETEKESVCGLLRRLEEKAATFLTSLTTARDLGVVQEEIAAQQVGNQVALVWRFAHLTACFTCMRANVHVLHCILCNLKFYKLSKNQGSISRERSLFT